MQGIFCDVYHIGGEVGIAGGGSPLLDLQELKAADVLS
jgi:hypothetical protein